METFFDEEPSSGTEDMDRGPSRRTSSAGSVTEIEEQHRSSGIDDIGRRLQDWVEEINDSRTADQNVIDGFQEELVGKVAETCRQMKQQLFAVCEANSCNLQLKLHELSDVLESCTKLNQDLTEASQALAGLREGLSVNPTRQPDM